MIAPDGSMMIHPVEWVAAFAAGLALLAWAWVEMRDFREIAARRRANGTTKAQPEIWNPEGEEKP